MFQGEYELEAELEDLMSILTESNLEGETQSDPAILSFKIPEAPYSDEAMHLLHKVIEVVEAAHTTIGVFGEELLGMIGAGALAAGAELLATLAGALVGIIGPLAAIGAGVAEGRAKVSRERLKIGFAFGVVIGAHGRQWSTAKSMYWQFPPDHSYGYDQGAVIEAQKAFDLGLATGFVQGRDLAKYPNKKNFFWNSLYRVVSPVDKNFFLSGTWKSWSQNQWYDFYATMMGAFFQLYLKD